jgi:hypothetical protein
MKKEPARQHNFRKLGTPALLKLGKQGRGSKLGGPVCGI